MSLTAIVLLCIIALASAWDICPGAAMPKAVKNGRVKCTSDGGCQLECKPRFLFPDGEKSRNFTCVNNQWTLDYNKNTECRALCKPPCAHGGTCIRPNTCDCSETGYKGKICYQRVICDPECLNGGLCIHNICVCDPGFSGNQCEVNAKLPPRVASISATVGKHPPQMTKQPCSDEEILFQVASGHDENDKPFTIECEAEGEPAPRYRWMKNGKEFDWQIYDSRISQEHGGGTLVFSSPRDEDFGYYQCFAGNEFGTATSNSVLVRKSGLDSFTIWDPIAKSVNEGDPIGLKCQPPDGYPKPQIDWIILEDRGALRVINSSRLTVDPEGTLWFSNVTRNDGSDDFTYSCSAVSTFHNEYKLGNRIYLRVYSTDSTAVQSNNEPKLQYASKKNTVVLKGKSLELWCIYSGTPLPKIQWRKNGGPLPMDRIEMKHYGKLLAIKNVDLEDEGHYECESSNGIGDAKSYTFRVGVETVPYFIREPESQNKAEGEVVEFMCETAGIPRPEQYWIFNGIQLAKAPYNPRRIREDNKITIYNLTKADIGNYGCNSSNPHGYVYKDVYVNVIDLPPTITTPPSDMKSVNGQTVNMVCRAFGSPKPRITWVKGGAILAGDRYRTSDKGDLIIRNVTFTDEGYYTCTAENEFGKKKAYGSLVVEQRTKIMDAPQDYEVVSGQTAIFRCAAVADNEVELKIHWLKDGQEINFANEPRFVQQSDLSLSITKTTKLDSGIYTCCARTPLDEVSENATLIVQVVGKPPQMIKQPPSDEELLFQVASRQYDYDKPFIIECEAEGDPAPTYQWMKNGKEFDWQIYDWRIVQQPGRGTVVISSPKDIDVGHYQCFAQNELGTATSNSVFVKKAELDSFEIQDPITKIVNEGDPIGLKCQPPDGYPKPKVYWMIQNDRGALRAINSSRLTVGPEGTLWFSNVTRNDGSNDFTYSCSAVSNFLNEYKLGNRVYLLVNSTGSTAVQSNNEPKLQYVSKKNTVVLKGNTLELWCIYSGTPLPQIQWRRKNGGPLPMDRTETQLYGKLLVIKNVDIDDRGQYECDSSNGIGAAKSYTFRVGVEAAPYFIQEPEIQTKVEGEVVEFMCETAGIPSPEQYWIFNGLHLSNARYNPRRIIEHNKITIYNLTKEDIGNYGCNSSNIHGYIYKDVYVNVIVPLAAPKNFKMIELRDATTALFAWKPVSKVSTRGHFEGYKIQTWTEYESEDMARDIIVENSNEAKGLVDSLVPYSNNFVRVLAYNGAYNGPPSETIQIETPEGVPGPVDFLNAKPMGSSALFLTWRMPRQHNGILTGYNIYYQEVQGTDTLDLISRDPQINDPTVSRAKLTPLKPATKYRITIKARTMVGEGTAYYIERSTSSKGPTPPGEPLFIWSHITTTNGMEAIRITWIPNFNTNPGSHFYVQYRLKGASQFQRTSDELYRDYLVLKDLQYGKIYEMRIVAVDGEYETNSAIDEIMTNI